MGSVADVLGNSDKLKGVADAMKIAGLVEMLNTNGPFTVLAPNDEALAQVPRSFFNSLLENKDELKRTVLYHIIHDEIDSTKLKEMLKNSTTKEIETMEGHSVVLGYSGDLRYHFTVNGATIVSADLKADNGVIHTIDSVLYIDRKVKE